MSYSGPGGKGHAPRPFSVSEDVYASNWERTFGKKVEDNGNSDESTARESEEAASE